MVGPGDCEGHRAAGALAPWGHNYYANGTMGAAFPPARMGEGRNYVPKPTPELSRRGHTLRWMTRIEHHATRRSVRWPALLVLGALGLGVLILSLIHI